MAWWRRQHTELEETQSLPTSDVLSNPSQTVFTNWTPRIQTGVYGDHSLSNHHTHQKERPVLNAVWKLWCWCIHYRHSILHAKLLELIAYYIRLTRRYAGWDGLWPVPKWVGGKPLLTAVRRWHGAAVMRLGRCGWAEGQGQECQGQFLFLQFPSGVMGKRMQGEDHVCGPSLVTSICF